MSRTITPAAIVKSTFHRKKKLNLGAKIGNKGLKCFTISTSLSKRNSSKPTDRNRSNVSRVSVSNVDSSSGKDLDRVSSLIQKLREVSKVKDKLAMNNQNLKFRIAELQKEKYSLSQLNK